MAYAKSVFGKAYLMPIYQVSRFAQPQPFDLMICEYDRVPILVEVRSNAWGTGKPQTKQLACLPGLMERQIWMFTDGHSVPRIRRWTGLDWQELLCEALSDIPIPGGDHVDP